MSIELYWHPLSPPSRAVMTLVKHLDLKIKKENIKETNPFQGETAKPEFLKLNPTHTIPVLNDEGFILYESRAILAYLANKFPGGTELYPVEVQARANVDKMLHFDGTTFYQAVLGVILPMFLNKQPDPPVESKEKLTKTIKLLEDLMEGRKYMAGDAVSIADISIAASWPILKLMGEDFLSDRMNAWYDRVCVMVPDLEEVNDQANYSPYIQKDEWA